MPAPLLVVQNSDEGLGHLAPALAEAGLSWRTVLAHRGEPVPAELGDAAGLVVLGGPPSAHDPASGPWQTDVMRLLRAAHAARRPVLGVCLGAQQLAHALGGRARPGDAGPEAGYAPVRLAPWAKDDPLLRGLPAAPTVLHLHRDTYVPPPGAVRLASSDRYEEQAFRVGRSWGLQFHVEMDAATLAAGDADDLASLGVDLDALLAQARTRAPEMAALCRSLARGLAELASEPGAGDSRG